MPHVPVGHGARFVITASFREIGPNSHSMRQIFYPVHFVLSSLLFSWTIFLLVFPATDHSHAPILSRDFFIIIVERPCYPCPLWRVRLWDLSRSSSLPFILWTALVWRRIDRVGVSPPFKSNLFFLFYPHIEPWHEVTQILDLHLTFMHWNTTVDIEASVTT